MTYRLLDLFCGAGGAAMGYHRAGFEVVGVDIEPQPHYPFEFIQADAMEFPLDGFDVIHASPPCQGYSIMRNLPWLRDKEYPLLIEPTRERLETAGVPYIIENVAGARRTERRPHGMEAAWLCGGMFGLPFYRHRYFETNWFWMQPGHPRHIHTIRNGRTLGARARDIVHNGARRVGANVGHAAGVADARVAMGIDWMTRDEITQAIPPAYTEYIGRCLLSVMTYQASREIAGIPTPSQVGSGPLSVHPVCRGDSDAPPCVGGSRRAFSERFAPGGSPDSAKAAG